jgi:hypothetical protein
MNHHVDGFINYNDIVIFENNNQMKLITRAKWVSLRVNDSKPNNIPQVNFLIKPNNFTITNKREVGRFCHLQNSNFSCATQ